MSFILELIKDIIFTILLWLILFPIVMVLATPVILTVAIFGRNDKHPVRVAHGYGNVFGFWLDHGVWCIPWGRPD
jgi:hypothetical protein